LPTPRSLIFHGHDATWIEGVGKLNSIFNLFNWLFHRSSPEAYHQDTEARPRWESEIEQLRQYDRAEKKIRFGKSVESAGPMPPEYYERDYRVGKFSRDGAKIYAPTTTDQERLALVRASPPGSFPPEVHINRQPAPDVICTIYNPTQPAVRRAAKIVKIEKAGRILWVQREYSKQVEEFSLRKSGFYRTPSLRGENSPTLAVGIDSSTWLSFKQWRDPRGLASAPRWPDLKEWSRV
jgi:hypothetical protein